LIPKGWCRRLGRQVGAPSARHRRRIRPWPRLDQVAREAAAELGFEFDLERFALQLLRALFGLAAQLLDLALHAGDLGFLFGDFGFERVFGLDPGLVVNGGEVLLHPLLHRELDLPFGIIDFALLAHDLGLLGLGELRIFGDKDLLEIRKLPVALAKLFGQRKARLPGFRFNDGARIAFSLVAT
jgi:hypothetical protein